MTDMGNKVLVSVAPVAATDKVIIPEKIAEDVYDCYKAGAAMVHLHVRDREGNLTPDMTLLEETLAMIRRDSDIVIEVSTGGVSNLTIEERCAPLYSDLVEACSLNVGSTNLGRSVYCNPIDDVEYCIREMLKQKKQVPRCPSCNGILKPEVVLYGESLDMQVMEEAILFLSQADVLIVGGTSLVVYPAAGLLQYFRGSKLILINKEETAMDHRADLVIHDAIGKVMKEAVLV